MKVSPDDPLSVFALAGFLSVFTFIGLACIRWGWTYWRQGKHSLSEVAPMFLIGVFFTWFAFMMARDEAGWVAVAILLAANAFLLLAMFLPVPEGQKEASGPKDWLPSGRVMAGEPDLAPRTRAWLAAIPCYFLATAYVGALAGTPLPFLDEKWLQVMMRTQFLVIHSFPFLMLIALVRPTLLRWRILQWYIFVGFFSVYILLSRQDGWDGVIAFVAGTVGVYGGFLLRLSDQKALAQMGKRWLASFALFIGAAILFRTPEDVADWTHSRAALYLGCLFYLGTGILENLGVYERPWNLTRLFGKKAEPPPSDG